MARRYRRKKNNFLNIFFTIILLFLIGILCYKIYVDQVKPDKSNDNKNNKTSTTEKKDIDSNSNVSNDKKEDSAITNTNNTKEEIKNSNTVTDKSSTNEKKENKNEQARRGGTVNLELIGEENVTVSVGSKYKDAGVKATYSDGSDASAEVDIDNAVDTSKSGIYTVSYSAGNVVIIRRVTVE